MLKDNKDIVLKDTIGAEIFAKFFPSIFSTEDGVLPNVNKKINSCLSGIKFNEHDINTCLQTLPLKYSCGLDEIPIVFLKTLHNVLAFPHCLIFNIVLILVFYLISGGVLLKYFFTKEMELISKLIL